MIKEIPHCVTLMCYRILFTNISNSDHFKELLSYDRYKPVLLILVLYPLSPLIHLCRGLVLIWSTLRGKRALPLFILEWQYTDAHANEFSTHLIDTLFLQATPWDRSTALANRGMWNDDGWRPELRVCSLLLFNRLKTLNNWKMIFLSRLSCCCEWKWGFSPFFFLRQRLQRPIERGIETSLLENPQFSSPSN